MELDPAQAEPGPIADADHPPGAVNHDPPDMLDADPAHEPGVPAVHDAPDQYTFEMFEAALTTAVGVDMSIGEPQLDGAEGLSRANLLLLRSVLSYVLSLSRAYMTYLRFMEDARLPVALEHAQALLIDPTSVGQETPHLPTFAAAMPMDQFVGHVENLSYWQCALEWGPTPAVRDCLSPAAVAFYAWLGPDMSKHILMLLKVLCNNKLDWVTACSACPLRTTHLDLPRLDRRLQDYLRAGAFDTAAAAVMSLCNRALPVLERASQALFCVASNFPELPKALALGGVITHPTIADLVATRAAQFSSPAPAREDASMAVLPTSSSLPCYVPNFVRDDRINWIRTAEHKFKHVTFPHDAIAAGDVDSELCFHRYCCKVLNSRVLCMELSEAQIIEHLSMGLQQHDAQFTVAKARAQAPNCTVRSWLDAIRSAFFTSGEFRMNIETAWRNYKIGQVRDFNDLLHHIRTYYQLIFLDYGTLAGVMKLHDFAWHLFDKLTHLATGCHSPLARVIQTFFPHSELLTQMVNQLKQPQLVNSDLDKPALRFIEWSLQKLQVAKDSANIAQRYSAVQSQSADPIDFAALPRHEPDLAPRARTLPPRAQPVALASAGRSLSEARSQIPGTGHMQDHSRGRSAPPTGRDYSSGRSGNWQVPRAHQAKGRRATRRDFGGQNSPPRPQYPNLRELQDIIHSDDTAARVAFARRAAEDDHHPPHLRHRLRMELDRPDHPDTLHGLLLACNIRGTPQTGHDMVIYLLRSYYCFAKPLCCACRNSDHHQRDHDVSDCPALRNFAREVRRWLACPDNRGWGFRAPPPPQYQPGQPHVQHPSSAAARDPRPPPPPPLRDRAGPSSGVRSSAPQERYDSRSPSRERRPQPSAKRARNIR